MYAVCKIIAQHNFKTVLSCKKEKPISFWGSYANIYAIERESQT